MTMTNAALEGSYYEGEHPVGRPAILKLSGFEAILSDANGEDLGSPFHVTDLSVSPRVGKTDRFILLPSGRQFLCPDQPFLDKLPQEGRSEGLVSWLEARQTVAVFSVLIIVATLLFAYFVGLPAAAESISNKIPLHTENTLGIELLLWMDENKWFTPTEVGEDRQAKVIDNLNVLKKGLVSEDYLDLQFRQSELLGANAVALPGGIILITDKMMEIAETDEEILAVLAHEIAHVELRHFIRQVLQSSVVAVAATAITSDAATLSAAVAGLPAILLQSKYSREIEAEADTFAFDLLNRSGISPSAFADLMQRISNEQGREKGHISFLSTHPPTKERVEHARNSAATNQ